MSRSFRAWILLIVCVEFALTVLPSRAQPCIPPSEGLVSWWTADGTVDDKLGANPGTAFNGVTYDLGEVDQAFLFTNGAHIRVADSPSLHFTTAMTVEAWVYPESNGHYFEIVSKWDIFGNGGKSYDLSINPTGRAYFLVDADGHDGFNTTATTTNVVPLNQWSHLVGTYDGAMIRVYMNGLMEAETPYTYGIYAGNHDLGIGGVVGGAPLGTAGYTFDGKIDEVALYHRALSDSEIKGIYDAGAAGRCKGPVAPTILVQPAGRHVHSGLDASLKVVATGRPLAFQWQVNHENLQGATNELLVLQNVTAADQGTYSVVVSNSAGTARSTDAQLLVDDMCLSAPAGLAGWWPADGDANDHANGNNGMANAGIAYDSGEAGRAFSFDGSTGFIEFPASPGLDVGSGPGFTIEGWIRPADLNSPQIIAEWNSGDGQLGVQFYHSNPGVGGPGGVGANIVDTNALNHTVYSGPGVVDTNGFQHVALTYDAAAGIARLFRNGVQIQSATLGAIRPQTTFPLWFGTRISGTDSGEFYHGLMDEMAVYDRALSASELQAIYLAGNLGKSCSVPEVTSEPANQTVNLGANVTFSSSARGGLPLYFQWLLDGSAVAGATNSTLTLDNVQPSQAGSYSLQVSNSLGSAVSSNAVLTVNVISVYANGQRVSTSPITYGGTVTVQLMSLFQSGYLFYTLDSSEPTFVSSQYFAPFTLSNSATLRVLTYSSNFFESSESDPIQIIVLPNYALTVSNTPGGSVAISPNQTTYVSNSVVTLTAVPVSGWKFLQWLGDATGTNPTVSITMNHDTWVKGIFGTTLTTTAAGSGSVALNPPGGTYPYGTIVWLSAIPQPGSYFGIWGNSASGNANPLAFGITNANPTVSSLFGPVPSGQSSLTVVPVGNGRVSLSPQANAYTTGANVTITAQPNAGDSFLGWGGDAIGESNPLVFKVIKNSIIYANFSHSAELSTKASYEGYKPEGFIFSLIGSVGDRYEIEFSTNLLEWQRLALITNLAGTVQILDPTASNSPRLFYRANLLP